LGKYPSGLTITDISNGINASRITVSKYISILEVKEKVFSKKIGAYKLYYGSERNFISKKYITEYYAGLLTGMKEILIDKKKFKVFGHNICDYMVFPFGSPISVEKIPTKGGSLEKFMKYWVKMYPFLDFIQDDDVIIEKEIFNKGKEGLLRIKNLKIFEITENFDIHFHIIAGITEKEFEKFLKKKVVCDIQKIDLNEKLVEISINVYD